MKHTVPTHVVGRFEPVAEEAWRRMDNNSKAKQGKTRFLELPGALDASSERVRSWFETTGLTESRAVWQEVTVAPELPPRFVNLGFTSRCVDAFLGERGCELKVSGYDGVCGLTVNEERLLRSDRIDIYAVNPVRGLIGQMDKEALLAVPRRIDGVPVGDALIEWSTHGGEFGVRSGSEAQDEPA